jgi:GTP cyclohydrolase II
MIYKIIEGTLQTEVGSFLESIYSDGKDTAICLTHGNVINTDQLLIRIHSHCISSHVFLYTGCDCREQMRKAQEKIIANGSGVIIWLDQEGRSNGHAAKIASEKWKLTGMTQSDAYVAAGFKADNREYSLAIKIINEFKPKSILLLTNNPNKKAAVMGVDINVITESI